MKKTLYVLASSFYLTVNLSVSLHAMDESPQTDRSFVSFYRMPMGSIQGEDKTLAGFEVNGEGDTSSKVAVKREEIHLEKVAHRCAAAVSITSQGLGKQRDIIMAALQKLPETWWDFVPQCIFITFQPSIVLDLINLFADLNKRGLSEVDVKKRVDAVTAFMESSNDKFNLKTGVRKILTPELEGEESKKYVQEIADIFKVKEY